MLAPVVDEIIGKPSMASTKSGGAFFGTKHALSSLAVTFGDARLKSAAKKHMVFPFCVRAYLCFIRGLRQGHNRVTQKSRMGQQRTNITRPAKLCHFRGPFIMPSLSAHIV